MKILVYIKNYTNKISLFFRKIKFKKFFKNKTFKTVLISFLATMTTLIIVIAILWSFKDKILGPLVNNYIIGSDISKAKPILVEKVVSDTEDNPVVSSKEEEKVVPSVVNAVKVAKPAVVSIIITKEVPKYDISYENKEVIDKTTGKVIPNVYIQTPISKLNGTQTQKVGSGSGFLISSDGMIVTNRHVVDMADVKYTVLLNSGAEYSAKVLAQDSVLDVAIIKIEAKNLPYLKLADSDKLQVGESVVAIGNALGEFKNTVSSGVISGLSRNLLASGGNFKEFLYKVIQTDAAINKGNSGGPLLNLDGEVVGINVALAEDSSSIGFSLPINSVKSVIDQVRKTGKISRPYVGVRYIVIDQEVKAKLKLSVDYGVLVMKGATDSDVAVLPNSPASKAGIMENDIILSVDGEIVNANNDFMSLIRNKKIGESVNLRILSKGVEKTVTVKLEKIPE